MSIVILGGINEDVVTHVPTLPQRGETIHAIGVTRGAGGKGLNQAIAAARQGGAVRLLGAVGDDPAGAALLQVMAREGIDTGGVAVLPEQRTGQALIALSSGGDNTIIVDAGANAAYGAGHIADADLDARIFLTQFEASLEAIEALFTTPQAQRGIRILNAAPATQAGRALLPLADILILNETELQTFASLTTAPDAEDDIIAASRALITRSGQQVVVTLGARGCLFVDAREHIPVPGFAMKAIDTIGAGDCFCGVFATALDAGASVAESLRRANAAAALSVTQAGAGESAPTSAAVDRFLADHPGG